MRHFFLILFFGFVLCGIHAQADEAYKEALALSNNQEFMKALQIWESCIEKDTSNFYCYEQAALNAYKLGINSKAKKYFHQIEKDPDYYRNAAIQLSAIYEAEERIPRAIKYNTLLRDSFPQNPVYHKKLGALYVKAGIIPEAFVHYAKALSLNPQDITSIKAVSEIFMANSQYEEADSLLKTGLSLDPENTSISFLMAKNFYTQKQYDSTVVVLEKLKGIVDFNNYHNRMIGYSYLQIDSTDQAIWYLERSLVDESNPEFAHYYLANAYELKSEYETSIFHYKKAIEEGTSNGLHSYHRNLARLQKEENQLKEAIDNYQWAYKYKDDPLILLYLAQASDIYYKDKSIAINYYNKYINSNDTNASYKKYAKERLLYLKEIRHLNPKNN